MKFSALFLVVSLIGISVFGFAFDHAMMDGSSSDCIASTIDGTECPASIVGMALHHISALQTLTTIVVTPISSALLSLAFLLLLSVSIFLFYKNLSLSKPEFSPQYLRDMMLSSLFSRQKITSWLSLFELSPAL